MTKKQIDKMLLEGCGERDYNKVRLAINFGADVEAETNDGETPLHFASDTNRIEIAKLLLERGSDLEAKDDDGETPLDTAYSYEMKDLFKKYKKRLAKKKNIV